jgi:hypothetical protein
MLRDWQMLTLECAGNKEETVMGAAGAESVMEAGERNCLVALT